MSDQNGGEPERFRFSPKQVLGAVLALIVLVLVLQNTQTVRVDLLVWNVEWPLWVILVAMLVIGALIGMLLRWRARRQ